MDISGNLQVWELLIIAFMFGGVITTLTIHRNYHRQHFKHSDNRVLHQDPLISQSERARIETTLKESQIMLNLKLTEHIENDTRTFESIEKTLSHFTEMLIDELRRMRGSRGEA